MPLAPRVTNPAFRKASRIASVKQSVIMAKYTPWSRRIPQPMTVPMRAEMTPEIGRHSQKDTPNWLTRMAQT